MANDGDAAAWTIKNVPIETRQKALKAANFHGMTVGRWLIQAVDRQADLERANEVIPPGKPEKPVPAPMPEIDLHAFSTALTAALAVYQASGATPPKSLATNASTTLIRYMRSARGLNPRRNNGKPGQTMIIDGGVTLIE